MWYKQVHLVKHHFHGSHTQPVSQITAFCQWGIWLLPAGDSEMPIVITAFILKYSPDLIPDEMLCATNHVSLAWAKCEHTWLWETQGSLYLHLQVIACIHHHSTECTHAMLQTLNQDCEGVRNLTNIQTAHEKIGYFQSIDCLPSVLLVQTRNESQQKITALAGVPAGWRKWSASSLPPISKLWVSVCTG